MERSHRSSYLIWPHFLSTEWQLVCCEETQLPVCKLQLVRIGQSHGQLGRFAAHSLSLSSDEMRSDETRDVKPPLTLPSSVSHIPEHCHSFPAWRNRGISHSQYQCFIQRPDHWRGNEGCLGGGGFRVAEGVSGVVLEIKTGIHCKQC